MAWFHQLWLGVRRHPWRTSASAFAAYSACWTVTEPMLGFKVMGDSDGFWKVGGLIAIGLAYAGIQAAAPRSLDLRIPGTTSRVRIITGDLLAFQGHKIVATSEFFFTELGVQVARNSLLGKVIVDLYQGDGPRLGQMLQAGLAAQHGPGDRVDLTLPPRYPIGTTVAVQADKHLAFFCALSHVERPSLKATADLSDLLTTLTELWTSVRAKANGEAVAIALMGSGQSGVGMSDQDLLNLLLLSIRESSRRAKITGEIVIHLTDDSYDKVDLHSIKEGWPR